MRTRTHTVFIHLWQGNVTAVEDTILVQDAPWNGLSLHKSSILLKVRSLICNLPAHKETGDPFSLFKTRRVLHCCTPGYDISLADVDAVAGSS